MTIFIAAVCFFAGIILFAAYNIYILRIKYPEEASEIKIVKKYWTNEWAAFVFSTAIMVCYILIFPEIKHKSFKGYTMLENFRWFSVVLGSLSQWLAIAAFGVSKRYIKKKSAEIEQKYLDKENE